MIEKATYNLLSICFTVKNRSKWQLPGVQVLYLLPDCIDSLVKVLDQSMNVEVVISDYESTDWPLDEWLAQKLEGIDFRVVQGHGPYHNGAGRNLAAQVAKGDVLFFIDADMLLAPGMIEQGLKHVAEGKVYMPRSFYFINPEHTRGFWCSGKGNCMISRRHFEQVGGWPEPPGYRLVRNVDQEFYNRFEKHGILAERPLVDDFFHQYHPGRSVKNAQKPTQRHYIVDWPIKQNAKGS